MGGYSTLPTFNIFDEVPISVFFNYLKSMLSIGMPFFLILAAVIVIEWLLPLFRAAFQKHDSEDWEDSDDDD